MKNETFEDALKQLEEKYNEKYTNVEREQIWEITYMLTDASFQVLLENLLGSKLKFLPRKKMFISTGKFLRDHKGIKLEREPQFKKTPKEKFKLRDVDTLNDSDYINGQFVDPGAIDCTYCSGDGYLHVYKKLEPEIPRVAFCECERGLYFACMQWKAYLTAKKDNRPTGSVFIMQLQKVREDPEYFPPEERYKIDAQIIPSEYKNPDIRRLAERIRAKYASGSSPDENDLKTLRRIVQT